MLLNWILSSYINIKHIQKTKHDRTMVNAEIIISVVSDMEIKNKTLLTLFRVKIFASVKYSNSSWTGGKPKFIVRN